MVSMFFKPTMFMAAAGFGCRCGAPENECAPPSRRLLGAGTVTPEIGQARIAPIRELGESVIGLTYQRLF